LTALRIEIMLGLVGPVLRCEGKLPRLREKELRTLSTQPGYFHGDCGDNPLGKLKFIFQNIPL